VHCRCPRRAPVLAARDVWRAKGWGEASTGMAAVTSIMRAHQLFLAKVNEVLRPFELTFARYEVLAWLAWNAECEQLSLSQIAERLQVTRRPPRGGRPGAALVT
jgi:hypothetical protein